MTQYNIIVPVQLSGPLHCGTSCTLIVPVIDLYGLVPKKCAYNRVREIGFITRRATSSFRNNCSMIPHERELVLWGGGGGGGRLMVKCRVVSVTLN